MGMDSEEVEGRQNGWYKWIHDGTRGWRESEDHMTYVLRIGTDRNLLEFSHQAEVCFLPSSSTLLQHMAQVVRVPSVYTQSWVWPESHICPTSTLVSGLTYLVLSNL